MSTDLRLAWQLVRGSDRREWWRIALTALGAMPATGFALAAVAIASLRGQYHIAFGAGLLNQPGQRVGVVLTLLLLLIPVLGFLGQCARVGAVHRDRRLAALRLAGATPWQVRRIAALETGLACLLGSVLAVAVAVPVLLSVWASPTALAWAGMALIALAVPALGAATAALALRRVVASPLGSVRRVRTARRPGRVFLTAALLLAASAGLALPTPLFDRPHVLSPLPLIALALTLLVGTAAVLLTGWSSGLLGRTLAARAQRPALLIAAERLRDDPWAAARTHGAVLLVTVIGTGFVGVRQVLLAELHAMSRVDDLAMDMGFYTTGLDLTAAAILAALGLVLSALAVGTAESLATRRRGLAAQNAAGVPRAVLARTLFLETALPLAPAVAVAGCGGLAIGTWYSSLATDYIVHAVPYVSLLVPVAVYGCCLLAAATSLPLLHRSVRPAELRYV
ncbi:FtsX-like permease family protein [Streptomyces sp. AC550_RSS872]|uniref:FtsX-like permease family protein n=1 Tax=Streptomyces sp. AC550_RSS872 TaxID=2823689 RepID=UPI001C27367C|nr:FtsX-like permease family protein [Streptomyces sp. AC550_RSS872]